MTQAKRVKLADRSSRRLFIGRNVSRYSLSVPIRFAARLRPWARSPNGHFPETSHDRRQSAPRARRTRPVGLARLHSQKLARGRHDRAVDRRGRPARHDLESGDLREGDRSRPRVRRRDPSHRGARRARPARGLRRGRGGRHPSGRRPPRRGLPPDAHPGRLRQPRGLARARGGCRRHARRSAPALEGGRPAEPDDQGPGNPNLPAGDPHAARRRDQRQHHTSLRQGSLLAGRRGVSRRPGGKAR